MMTIVWGINYYVQLSFKKLCWGAGAVRKFGNAQSVVLYKNKSHHRQK
jgi:hypothetical protein